MGLKGSCLCGEIRYEIDSLDMPIVHCHCQTCRKAHAAPFALHRGVKRENFRWLSGIDSISTFESSPGKLRHFCKRCGSHLVAERLGQPHVIVRVATLDDDPGLSQRPIFGCRTTCHGLSTIGRASIGNGATTFNKSIKSVPGLATVHWMP